MAHPKGAAGGSARTAGGSVAPNPFRDRLHEKEEGIRHGKKESAVLVDADGLWQVINGKKWGVGIPVSTWSRLRGGLLTHNHPSSQLHRGRMGELARRARAGNLTDPLSPPDLGLAQRHGLREIRAVGANRKYRYRPGPGDSGIQEVHNNLISRGSKRTQAIYDRAKAKMLTRINNASGAKRDRLMAQYDRMMNGILAGQSYITQNYAFRQLKRMGYDVKAKRGRPLVR